MEGKYVYRWFCGLFLTIFATGTFYYVWYGFVEENNQTGRANLLMAAGIYAVLYIVVGRGLRVFRIVVDRKANLIIS